MDPNRSDRLGSIGQVLTDAKFLSMLGGVIISGAIFFGAPADKAAQAKEFALGVMGLVGVFIAGLAYHQGKNVESSVPSDRVSAAPPTVNVADGGTVNLGSPVVNTPSAVSTGSNRSTLGGLIALTILLCSLTGCGTSTQFALGIKPGALLVADRVTAYEKAKPSNDQAAQLENADKLRSAVSSKVDWQTVEQLWSALRGTYLNYVENDPDLRPDSKTIRKQTAYEIDTLLMKERGRHSIF